MLGVRTADTAECNCGGPDGDNIDRIGTRKDVKQVYGTLSLEVWSAKVNGRVTLFCSLVVVWVLAATVSNRATAGSVS